MPVTTRRRRRAELGEPISEVGADSGKRGKWEAGSNVAAGMEVDEQVEKIDGDREDDGVAVKYPRQLWRQDSMRLECGTTWVEVMTKVMPMRSILHSYGTSMYSKYVGRMSSAELKKKVSHRDWKGVFKLDAIPLKDTARDILESVSKEWIVNISEIILSYLGDLEDWVMLERVSLYIDTSKLESMINQCDGTEFSKNRISYLIKLVHDNTLNFPKDAAGLRKYKRVVPPRFGLSLQHTQKSIKNLVRSESTIPNLIRRRKSDGWEAQDEVKDLEDEISKIFKTSLHYYQRRTILWARSLEAEVRSKVKYCIPSRFFKPVAGANQNVVFDNLASKLYLDKCAKSAKDGEEKAGEYKGYLFSYKGGIIANEMGLGKTLTCIALILLDRQHSLESVENATEGKGDPKLESFTVSGTENEILDGIYHKRGPVYIRHLLRSKALTGQIRLSYLKSEGKWIFEDKDCENMRKTWTHPYRGMRLGEIESPDEKNLTDLSGKTVNIFSYEGWKKNRRSHMQMKLSKTVRKTIKINPLEEPKHPLREGRIVTNATLIICPSHLAKQWKQEVAKFLLPKMKKQIKVLLITTMPQLNKVSISDIRNADIVVVSIQLFLNPTYQKHSLLYLFTKVTLETHNLTYDHHARVQQNTIIEAFFFKRVVLDEGHELFTKSIMSQKISVMTVIMCIKSQTRWYVSGTPFPDNDITPRGALRFLRASIDGEEFLQKEAETSPTDQRIFDIRRRNEMQSRSNPMIRNTMADKLVSGMLFWSGIGAFLDHMLFSRLFCRYTTLFVKGVYEVPDFETEVVRLSMHPIERTLYEIEANRIGHSQDRLRELCAHPYVAGLPFCLINNEVPDLKYCLKNALDSTGGILSAVCRELHNIRRPCNYKDRPFRWRKTLQYEGTLYEPMAKMCEQLRNYDRKNHYLRLIRLCKAKKKLESRIHRTICLAEFLHLRKEEIKLLDVRGCQSREDLYAEGDLRATYKLQRQLVNLRDSSIFTSSEYISDPYEHISYVWRDMLRGENVADEYTEIKDEPLPLRYNVSAHETPAAAKHLKESEVERYGSKIAYVVSRLKSLLQNPESRVILFSQWQKLFQSLQKVMDSKGIKYVLVRGNVHVKTSAIKKFNQDPQIKVIMLSLETSASGANLQKASHIILLDPPAGTKEEADAIEAQAIGRAHRQGQYKKLTVIRLVMKDTIEEELLNRSEETSSWMQS